MTLNELSQNLEDLNEDDCIFAKKPWSSNSDVIVAPLTDNFEVPQSVSALGFSYFLEVHVAREVLNALANRPEYKEAQLKLLLFYAENDAFPNWIHSEVI